MKADQIGMILNRPSEVRGRPVSDWIAGKHRLRRVAPVSERALSRRRELASGMCVLQALPSKTENNSIEGLQLLACGQ
jgi:hypothetical protein